MIIKTEFLQFVDFYNLGFFDCLVFRKTTYIFNVVIQIEILKKKNYVYNKYDV